MHAHLKSSQGEDASLGYCPLDLFAGARDADRVVRALGALWDAWVESGGAVNNLRVFVGGRRVVPSAEVRFPFPFLPFSFSPSPSFPFPSPLLLPHFYLPCLLSELKFPI